MATAVNILFIEPRLNLVFKLIGSASGFVGDASCLTRDSYTILCHQHSPGEFVLRGQRVQIAIDFSGDIGLRLD